MKRKSKPQRGKSTTLPPEAYDAEPRLALTFTDETIFLTRFERRTPVVTYPVSAQDVASAFEVFGASTGLLGPDTLFWQKRGGSLRIGIWPPPTVRALTFRR